MIEQKKITVEGQGNDMSRWFTEQIHEAMKATAGLYEAFDALRGELSTTKQELRGVLPGAEVNGKYQIRGINEFFLDDIHNLARRLLKLEEMVGGVGGSVKASAYDLYSLTEYVKNNFNMLCVLEDVPCKCANCGECAQYRNTTDSENGKPDTEKKA